MWQSAPGARILGLLSRLKLRELAAPLIGIPEQCKYKEELIYGEFSRRYDPRASYGMYTLDTDTPDVAVKKLMAHADRMIETGEYLVNLSFVDCLDPGRAIMVL